MGAGSGGGDASQAETTVALRLRVQALAFERRERTMRDGRGSKEWRMMLALGVRERLLVQLRKERRLHEKTLLSGTEVCNDSERYAGTTAMRTSSETGSRCSPSTSAGVMSQQEIRGGIISIRALCKKRFVAPDRGKDQEGRHVTQLPLCPAAPPRLPAAR